MLGFFLLLLFITIFLFVFTKSFFLILFLRIFAAAKVVSIYQKYTLTPFDEDENDVVADDDVKDDEIDDDGGKSVRERLIIMKFTMQVCSATDPKLLPMLFAVCRLPVLLLLRILFLLLLMELLMGKSRCCCCCSLLCSLLAMAQRPLTRIHSDMQSVPAHKHNLPQSSVNRIKS